MNRHLLAAVVLLAALPAAAGETTVAVAANFTEAAKEIATAFEAATGHKVVLSFGSTGQLYTQITQQAPFEVFLSADDVRPQQAVAEGLGVPGTVFTYAVGRLVLWSKDPALVIGEATLKTGVFTKVAIANPKTAPYGAAAVETLAALGLAATLEPKIVQGNNIAQTYQFIDTGNAELGFVARSQVIGRTDGSQWVIPVGLHKPIRQDAVLLKTGAGNEAAKAFHTFLTSPAAIAVIERYGYATGAAS